jgi:exocyst complex component Sec15
MQELTRYLSANMNSTLLTLPNDIKELIYFDALSHAANMILVGFEVLYLAGGLLTSLSGITSRC